jgi:hypothetical protein
LSLTSTQQNSSAQVRLTGLSCTTGILPAGSAGLCSSTRQGRRGCYRPREPVQFERGAAVARHDLYPPGPE